MVEGLGFRAVTVEGKGTAWYSVYWLQRTDGYFKGLGGGIGLCISVHALHCTTGVECPHKLTESSCRHTVSMSVSLGVSSFRAWSWKGFAWVQATDFRRVAEYLATWQCRSRRRSSGLSL